MHTHRRVMKYPYQMSTQKCDRQKSYLAAYDSVPKIHSSELFFRSISGLLNGPTPPSISSFKRWLHFHKISQISHITNEVTS